MKALSDLLKPGICVDCWTKASNRFTNNWKPSNHYFMLASETGGWGK